MFGKELSIRFTVRVFRERLSICECASFPIGFKGGFLSYLFSSFTYLLTRNLPRILPVGSSSSSIFTGICDQSSKLF